jgi:hypothetical protein
MIFCFEVLLFYVVQGILILLCSGIHLETGQDKED